MSEIRPLDESIGFLETEPSGLSPFWEKGGTFAFYGFGAIAAGAFTSTQKKKRYMMMGAIAEAPATPIPITEGNSAETCSPQSNFIHCNATEERQDDPQHVNPQNLMEQTAAPQEGMPAFIPSLNTPSLPCCTEAEKENIQVLFNALATKSYFDLGIMQEDLERRGAAIDHLHPFQLLAVIFSDKQLKDHIKAVMKSSLPWPLSHKSPKEQFLKGIRDNLKRESERGNVEPHIQDFAKKLSVLTEEIRPLIQNRAWERLIFHLIEKSGGLKDQTFQE